MIIGIGHEDGVGKSTFARMLLQYIDADILSLASPVKAHAYELFSYLGLKTEDYYECYPGEKDIPLACGKTPRDLWIGLGDGMRELHAPVWLNAWLSRAASVKHCIAPDVRKRNEAEAILDAGGLLIHLSNSRVPQKPGKSFSELGDFTRWTYEIDNDGTLDYLREKAHKLVLSLVLDGGVTHGSIVEETSVRAGQGAGVIDLV